MLLHTTIFKMSIVLPNFFRKLSLNRCITNTEFALYLPLTLNRTKTRHRYATQLFAKTTKGPKLSLYLSLSPPQTATVKCCTQHEVWPFHLSGSDPPLSYAVEWQFPITLPFTLSQRGPPLELLWPHRYRKHERKCDTTAPRPQLTFPPGMTSKAIQLS